MHGKPMINWTNMRRLDLNAAMQPCRHYASQITSKRVVRSSAGAETIYTPFWGVIRVEYPKVWYQMFNLLVDKMITQSIFRF